MCSDAFVMVSMHRLPIGVGAQSLQAVSKLAFWDSRSPWSQHGGSWPRELSWCQVSTQHTFHLPRTSHARPCTLAIHLVLSWPSLILKMLLSKSWKSVLKADSFLMTVFKSWKARKIRSATTLFGLSEEHKQSWLPEKHPFIFPLQCYHSNIYKWKVTGRWEAWQGHTRVQRVRVRSTALGFLSCQLADRAVAIPTSLLRYHWQITNIALEASLVVSPRPRAPQRQYRSDWRMNSLTNLYYYSV